MTYQLTQADINSITDLEIAFRTTRLLPQREDIPKEFWDGNCYTNIVDCLFSGVPLPAGEISFNEGFEGDEKGIAKMHRFISAHLGSWEPKHERKIAGLGYALSKIFTYKPE